MTPEFWAARIMDTCFSQAAVVAAVRDIMADATNREREACARLKEGLEAKCDRMAVIGGPEEEKDAGGPDFFFGYRQALADFAAAIRART